MRIFFGRALVYNHSRQGNIFSKLGRAVRYNLCSTEFRKGFSLPSLTQSTDVTIQENYVLKKLVYSISETRSVFTIPLFAIGMAAKLISISPFETSPFSVAILLISSTVSSVLTNLS